MQTHVQRVAGDIDIADMEDFGKIAFRQLQTFAVSAWIDGDNHPLRPRRPCECEQSPTTQCRERPPCMKRLGFVSEMEHVVHDVP